MNMFKELTFRHPTWQSHRSRGRAAQFLLREESRAPGGLRLNIGSASRRYSVPTVNLDLAANAEVDIQADAVDLPFKNNTVESVVCTGVLEHVIDPGQAVGEIFRVLKSGGGAFFEVPFMQTRHAAPCDFSRWTPEGIRQLLREFQIVELHVAAGPASALAWLFQETMALLFSFRTPFLYKVGLRIFGYFALAISWLDLFLENHPLAYQGASSYAVAAVKAPGPETGGGG
jgi:SAM-dependent methyltransferase